MCAKRNMKGSKRVAKASKKANIGANKKYKKGAKKRPKGQRLNKTTNKFEAR